ncbi:MAG: CrcB family protein, partial [Candidatus Latescibacterota bacterium]|nr:CrcB family protein [Candidatus Latescibacterota bacterium]
MTQILFVGLGGFAGAVCRFLMSGAVHRLVPLAVIPWGTLIVNVAGCVLIGALGPSLSRAPCSAIPYAYSCSPVCSVALPLSPHSPSRLCASSAAATSSMARS